MDAAGTGRTAGVSAGSGLNVAGLGRSTIGGYAGMPGASPSVRTGPASGIRRGAAAGRAGVRRGKSGAPKGPSPPKGGIPDGLFPAVSPPLSLDSKEVITPMTMTMNTRLPNTNSINCSAMTDHSASCGFLPAPGAVSEARPNEVRICVSASIFFRFM